jgi:hypothetical protein
VVFGFSRPTAPPARPEIEDREPDSSGSHQRYEIRQRPREGRLTDLGSAPLRDGTLIADISEPTSPAWVPDTLAPISDLTEELFQAPMDAHQFRPSIR